MSQILETSDNRLFRSVDSNGVTFTGIAVRKVHGSYVGRADADPRVLRLAGCRVVAECSPPPLRQADRAAAPSAPGGNR